MSKVPRELRRKKKIIATLEVFDEPKEVRKNVSSRRLIDK